jgi:site-specific DNA-adenine methylase
MSRGGFKKPRPSCNAPDTLFFIDPPYLPKTRDRTTRYRHDMTEAEHIALLERIKQLEGTAIVAGYPSELYDDTLAGWRREERPHYARSNGVRPARPPKSFGSARHADPAALPRSP